MLDKVTYNQLISLSGTTINFQTLRGSYAADGKLIFVYGNSRKLLIYGKNVYSTGQNKRIRELVSIARDNVMIFPRSQYCIM